MDETQPNLDVSVADRDNTRSNLYGYDLWEDLDDTQRIEAPRQLLPTA